MPEMPKSASLIFRAAPSGPGFSLAAKLYSIFALIAVLTAAIAVLSDFNSRRNAALTEADRDGQPRPRSMSSASIRWSMRS